MRGTVWLPIQQHVPEKHPPAPHIDSFEVGRWDSGILQNKFWRAIFLRADDIRLESIIRPMDTHPGVAKVAELSRPILASSLVGLEYQNVVGLDVSVKDVAAVQNLLSISRLLVRAK